MNAKLRHLTVFILLLFTTTISFADGKDDKPRDLKITVYDVLSRPIVSVKTPATGFLDYQANNAQTLGFSVKYQRYGISLSPSLWGTSNYKPMHPDTKFFDAKGFYYGENWGADLYYQYFRGFFAPARGTQTYDNPGLNLSSFTLNVYRPLTKGSQIYNMTEGLSHNGIHWNFYYLLGGSYHDMETGITLLPGLSDSSLKNMIDLRQAKTYDAFGALGVSLNTYLGGFFFDPGLFPGWGMQYRSVNTNMDRYGGTIKLSLIFNIGYQGDSFELGIKAQDDGNTLGTGTNSRIGYQSIILKLYLELFF